MSKDIRSYFTSKKDVKKKPEKVSVPKHKIFPDSDEDDVIEVTPKAEMNPKRNKKVVLISSSDSETDERADKKRPKVETQKPTSNKPKSSNEKKKMKLQDSKREKRQLKPITALEMFGTKPVKRIEAPKVQKTETESDVHSDEDFISALKQLDDEELLKEADIKKPKVVTETNGVAKDRKKSPKKEPHVNDSSKKNKRESKPSSSPERSVIMESENDQSLFDKSTDNVLNDSEVKSTPKRKRKLSANDSLNNSGIDPDEERYEKKRHCAMLYQKYLHRSGPKKPGSKEIPKGKPNCFKGLVFIVTGVLESLERDEANSIITDLGGKVNSGVTGKVNYMITGDDAGPVKIEKARKLGVKIISEDEFLELIRIKSGDSSGKQTNSIEHSPTNKRKITEKTHDKKLPQEEKPPKTIPSKSPSKNKQSSPAKSKHDRTDQAGEADVEVSPFFAKPKIAMKHVKKENGVDASERIKENKTEKTRPSIKTEPESVQKGKVVENIKREKVPVSLAWVDKYKPKDIHQIVGQQGDNSNVKKLLIWLKNWYKNRDPNKKLVRPSPWAKNDDGAFFKAALLSGPPGIGKTTTATLVCKELEFDTVEFNASDTRNKRLLHEEVGHLLKNKTIAVFYNSGEAPSKKRALLMDEVDGMSGNEDRGGMQELINLIKDSSIPIICMCNDRNHQKVRSLANYCFDLRFTKPRVEQIRASMMSLCFKEGIQIRPDVLDKIIIGTENDIRQTINHLSLWSAGSEASAKDGADKNELMKKNIKVGPWEVVKKVFSADDQKRMSIHEKSDLFFHDYSIGPLFVQDNYLNVTPHVPKNEHLRCAADAADSLSMGDLVDARIRGSNAWSLLPLMAMYSSVIPGAAMSGHVSAQINFPAWLGKNSRRSKFRRMLNELQVHMRLRISGSQEAVNLDYLPHIRDSILRPLAKERIDDALDVMRTYNLLREDLDNICEMSAWPRFDNPMTAINGKVKAAFTRAYNKESAALPYATDSGSMKKRSAAIETEDAALLAEDEALAEDSDHDNDDVSNDAMIKAKKPTAKATSAKNKGVSTKNSNAAASTSKRAAGPTKPRGKKK